jgi:uncharacterized protein YjbI with pentapeptide repeats
MADEKKPIDSFDVGALEKSLNDTATRVSGLWISFLLFSLYLLAAVAAVTPRQLLLAEPVKLPVLNIELPLLGFFLFAPVLFFIFHAYMLIQIILLGRTAAVYNEAIDRNTADAVDNARVRQRLANTLFAQIFSGSPRERSGWLGWLLKAMAYITLVASPILIIFMFQFAFLPFHNHVAIWIHRALIVFELVAVCFFWPMMLDANTAFTRSAIWQYAKELVAFPVQRIRRKPTDQVQNWSQYFGGMFQTAACLVVVFVSFWIVAFPGEPHVNLIKQRPLLAVECRSWFMEQFDQLHLVQVDVIDSKKLDEIEYAIKKWQLDPRRAERPRYFQGRDLACADLRYANLRRVDFAGANLSRAKLDGASLHGANLENARLHDASLNDAHLEGAILDSAKMHRAKLYSTWARGGSLKNTELYGAELYNIQLQGADASGVRLQGAILNLGQLQGASLFNAQLQGSYLSLTNFQGANLVAAQLQAADLWQAQMQGANLVSANLQNAFLNQTNLQGANLVNANLEGALIAGASVWRAAGANCKGARVTAPKLDPDLGVDISGKRLRQANEFIDLAVNGLPDGQRREQVVAQMRFGLGVWDDGKTSESTAIWAECAQPGRQPSQEDIAKLHIDALHGIICSAGPQERPTIAAGLERNLTWRRNTMDSASALLAGRRIDATAACPKAHKQGGTAGPPGAAGPPK